MIAPEQLRIDTPRGQLHAARWNVEATGKAGRAPIVLLHDSLGCVALWRDFPARLAHATQRTVIAYDRLGFGRSDPHPGPIAPTFIHDEATTDFAAVRAQLRLERFALFGHSVGGGMAVTCAAAHADGCVAVVAESAQAFVEDRTLQGVREAQLRFRDPAQVDRLRRYHGDKAPWVLSSWIDTWLSPGYAEWSLEAELRAVRLPVLAIHGDQDEFGSPHHPQTIADLAGEGSRALLLAGCGHVPHRDRPDEVLAAVRPWLAAVP